MWDYIERNEDADEDADVNELETQFLVTDICIGLNAAIIEWGNCHLRIRWDAANIMSWYL